MSTDNLVYAVEHMSDLGVWEVISIHLTEDEADAEIADAVDVGEDFRELDGTPVMVSTFEVEGLAALRRAAVANVPEASPVPTFALRHAYTSRDTGSYSGGDHIIVATGEIRGRLSRGPGDALCKPRGKFRALFQGSDHETKELSVCKLCRTRAARLGIDVGSLSHETNLGDDA